MREAMIIERFRRRLVELGCPMNRIERTVEELTDHHEDLKNAALEEGLSEAAAEARAAEQLGEPAALAEHLSAVLRNSSWCGRHPVLGFCVLPPIVIVLIAFLGLLIDSAVGSLYLSAEELRLLASDKRGLEFLTVTVEGTYYGAVALTAILFCRLAWRSARGLNWALAACAICLVHGYFFSFHVTAQALVVGYNFPSRVQDMVATAIPLLVAFATYAWHCQRISMSQPERELEARLT